MFNGKTCLHLFSLYGDLAAYGTSFKRRCFRPDVFWSHNKYGDQH